MQSAILQGQELKFNVGILSVDNSADGNNELIDVSPGSLTYLEIEDNLLDAGVRGSISIKNPMQMLDRVKALSKPENVLYLNVSIEDPSSSHPNIEDKKVEFMALLENSSSITKDIINNEILYNYEEAATAMLKKVSLTQILGNDSGNNINRVLSEMIFYLIELWSTGLNQQGAEILSEKFNKQSGGIGNLASFWLDVNDSVYDVLKRLSESVQIDDKFLPILKIKNESKDGKQIDRKFTFDKLFSDRHKEFITAITTNTGGDFSDVYGEEFVLAPEKDKSGGVNSSPIFNTVENFEAVKVDIETAREQYWGDYSLNNGPIDPTKTAVEILDFAEIVSSFEEDEFGEAEGVYSAIPILKKNQKKIFKADKSDNTEEGATILRNHAHNIVKRSFLFLNDSIIFTVKGNIGRKPGMFVTINGGDVFGRTAPDNVWFIISVKHMFKELNYENEIVAVKLFGNKDTYNNLVSGDVTTQPASRPASPPPAIKTPETVTNNINNVKPKVGKPATMYVPSGTGYTKVDASTQQ